LEGLREKNTQSQSQSENMAAELEGLREKNAQSQSQSENMAAELENLREKYAQSQSQSENMAAELEGLREKNAQSQSQSENMTAELEDLREKNAQSQSQAENMVAELESLREKNAQSQLQAENMAALLVSQGKAEETIEQLKTENEQLRNGGDMLNTDNAQLKRDLHQTLEEMEHVQSQLADANTKILELEKHPVAPIPNIQVGDGASISQVLRQPMSSIVGYTDLLLGESVGILGALQRKFLERIKASSERIGNLVDNLTQMTSPGTGVVESKSELLDLNLIIDNAMSYTSSQIREKNITLRLDLAEIALRLHADRDALQQILIHLLQNATAATRAEGSVVLRVRLLSEDNHHFLSIQVTDSGGGITPGDIPHVFARRYRAEYAHIQGVGDTGVGLSIAKTLIEAQDGRIWVETESGVGSTFSVLIPVVVESP
jgi:signal transduction histidine kinase